MLNAKFYMLLNATTPWIIFFCELSLHTKFQSPSIKLFINGNKNNNNKNKRKVRGKSMKAVAT